MKGVIPILLDLRIDARLGLDASFTAGELSFVLGTPDPQNDFDITVLFNRLGADEMALEIEGNRSRGLIDVEQQERTDLAAPGGDRADVLDVARAKHDVGDRDDAGALVDRLEEPVGLDRDTVFGRDLDDLCAVCLQTSKKVEK